jgi:signal transduction histidine kinase/FixJ family two-component response regulator
MGHSGRSLTGMLPEPSIQEHVVLAETFKRPHSRMTARERLAEAIVGGGFMLAALLLWLRLPPGHFAAAPALVCLLVLVLALRIRIDTPFGATVPAQLAYVPLLFATPVAVAPVAVVAAMVLARLPDVIAGNVRRSRLILSVGNAWFAVGPAAVFAIAGVQPASASAVLLVGALAAQFGVDFAASAVRLTVSHVASLRDQLSETWVYVVDGALSTVALLVAERIHDSPVTALAPLPLLALVAMFARERRQRLESLIELNTAYRRARDEAIEASNMKSAFLRNVSHEIRTPMNGVIGMNEVLMQTELSDEQRSYAEQVERSGEQMLAIINDILDVSKIETGRLELDVDDFNLHETIETGCATAMLEAQEKQVELMIEIDSHLPRRVRGDGARVGQVLANIVGNAVKFTEQGSVTVRAWERPAPGGGHVLFEVIDTGIGLEPQTIDRMFEPFMQADVSMTRRYGGNGLGLAIAKELVDLMGGKIGAESTPGCGSRFWFELALPEAAPMPIPLPRNRATSANKRYSDQGAPLVLVVEDSPVNRLVAVHVLERSGFRTHVVNDGREALGALSMQTYDAVLMDCQMPEIDGYEATRELRRRERGGRHTPVIAMTAHAMTGDREKCLAAGMDDYITKPVRSQTLTETLQRWISGAADGTQDASSRRAESSALESSPSRLTA